MRLGQVGRQRGDAGHDLVGAAGKRAQHPPRVRHVARLAEHRAVEHDDGVEAQHEVVGPVTLGASSDGLLGGEGGGEGDGVAGERRVEVLRRVDRGDDERAATSHSSSRRLRGDWEASTTSAGGRGGACGELWSLGDGMDR